MSIGWNRRSEPLGSIRVMLSELNAQRQEQVSINSGLPIIDPDIVVLCLRSCHQNRETEREFSELSIDIGILRRSSTAVLGLGHTFTLCHWSFPSFFFGAGYLFGLIDLSTSLRGRSSRTERICCLKKVEKMEARFLLNAIAEAFGCSDLAGSLRLVRPRGFQLH